MRVESDVGGGDDDKLLELYRLAVEEYHFQVNLNWQRTQYFLAFNAAVLGLAIGLLGGPGGRVPVLTALLFAFGGLAAVSSLMAQKTQHDYYRQTRDAMKRLEEAMKLPADFRLQTTKGMGSPRKRTVSVNEVVRNLLLIIAVIDFGAAFWAVTKAF